MREKLEAVKRQLATGSYTDTKLTLVAYLERWLGEKKQNVKPTTLETHTLCVNRFIVPRPRAGRTPLDKLTPMQGLVNEIHDACGAARAAKCRAVLFNRPPAKVTRRQVRSCATRQ